MRNDTLKLVAILSMLTDHIGLFFFPQIEIFRVVGRIAFPLFAFGVAVGCYYTKNIKKYTIRLLVFALFSTIPHYLVINNSYSEDLKECEILILKFFNPKYSIIS